MIVRVKTWFAHIHAFTCVLAHAYAQNTRVIVHGGGPIISVWIIRQLKWLHKQSRHGEKSGSPKHLSLSHRFFLHWNFESNPFPRWTAACFLSKSEQKLPWGSELGPTSPFPSPCGGKMQTTPTWHFIRHIYFIKTAAVKQSCNKSLISFYSKVLI